MNNGIWIISSETDAKQTQDRREYENQMIKQNDKIAFSGIWHTWEIHGPNPSPFRLKIPLFFSDVQLDTWRG